MPLGMPRWTVFRLVTIDHTARGAAPMGGTKALALDIIPNNTAAAQCPRLILIRRFVLAFCPRLLRLCRGRVRIGRMLQFTCSANLHQPSTNTYIFRCLFRSVLQLRRLRGLPVFRLFSGADATGGFLGPAVCFGDACLPPPPLPPLPVLLLSSVIGSWE